MERGAELPGLVVERKMRRRPSRIARRTGMKIEGAVAEPGEHAWRDDFRRHERDQPGPAQANRNRVLRARWRSRPGSRSEAGYARAMRAARWIAQAYLPAEGSCRTSRFMITRPLCRNVAACVKRLLTKSLAGVVKHFRILRRAERFPAKWIPVRVKKTRQNKRQEPPFRF